MDIRSIKLVFFSPTETTAKIVNKIAQGINPDIVSRIDLTPPGARSQDVAPMNEELTIIGTPVYVQCLYQEVPNRSKKMGKLLDRPYQKVVDRELSSAKRTSDVLVALCCT